MTAFRARWRRARTTTWRSRLTWTNCWRGCVQCCGGRRARRRGRCHRLSRTSLCIDFASAEVAVGGRPVAMSASEFRLLRFLARNRDRVFTPAQLVEEVWGPEYAGDRHLVRVYVRRVRQKIERDSEHPRHLVTKPGVGYVLRRHG